jgi:isopenicillin-N N-acyltransferase-like protein
MFKRRLLYLACFLAAVFWVAGARDGLAGHRPKVGPATSAADTFRFPEGKYLAGELKYINGLPVLVLEGTPEEIGRQEARLAPKISRQLWQIPKQILAKRGAEAAWPAVVTAGRMLFARVPADHRKELETIAKVAQVDEDTLVVANTLLELRRLGGCSTLIVQGNRSAAEGPLFGRNFDFPPMGILDRYSLVGVYRPRGKHAFAAVGFPGLIGVASGMNDAGLALATLDVYASADGSAMFNPAGTPLLFCYRRVLEECATVKEAEKLLRSIKPTTWMNLAVCDPSGGAVFELTPKTVAVRQPVDGALPCTNHFRTPGLTVGTRCPRYETLEKSLSQRRFTWQDVARAMDAVNQGPNTLQTMVFEPKSGKLHLSIGPGPASSRPLKTLELGPLLKPREVAVGRD